MSLPQFIYKALYHKRINYILRNINSKVSFLLPNYVRLPPSGIMRLDTKSGAIKMATNQTSYIAQLLFWKGYRNFEYSAIFEELIKEMTCFLDIGANIGYYSLLAARCNPTIKVYAFEPAAGPKYFLNRNIKLNHFDKQIEAIDAALSTQKGEITFYEVNNDKYTYLKHNLAGESNAGTKTTSRNFVQTHVQAMTLTDFVAANTLPAIDLIKIDTEGTEAEILSAGAEVIKSHEPIVICETLFNVIENDLEAFFGALDYVFFNHTPQGLKRVTSIMRKVDDQVRNCFFVPKSKIHLIQKFTV